MRSRKTPHTNNSPHKLTFSCTKQYTWDTFWTPYPWNSWGTIYSTFYCQKWFFPSFWLDCAWGVFTVFFRYRLLGSRLRRWLLWQVRGRVNIYHWWFLSTSVIWFLPVWVPVNIHRSSLYPAKFWLWPVWVLWSIYQLCLSTVFLKLCDGSHPATDTAQCGAALVWSHPSRSRSSICHL